MRNHWISGVLAIACIALAAMLWRANRQQAAIAAARPAVVFPTEIPSQAESQALLDRHVADLVLDDGVSFAEAVKALAHASGVNIHTNWKTLEGAGIDKETPVQFIVHDSTLRQALAAMLKSIDSPELAYVVEDGTVTITTHDEAAKSTVAVFFNIRPLIDLLMANQEARPHMEPSTAPTTGQTQFQSPQQEWVDGITRAIIDTVAPETWRENGGTTGSLREFDEVLVITQTPENIGLVKEFLGNLYRAFSQDDFSSIVPSTQPIHTFSSATMPATNESRSRSIVTEFINVRPLIDALSPMEEHALFSGESDRPQSPRVISRREIVEAISQVIEQMVDPDSFREGSGTVGSVRVFGEVLAISQSQEDIDAVRGVLGRLFAASKRVDFPIASSVGSPDSIAPAGPDGTIYACFNLQPFVKGVAIHRSGAYGPEWTGQDAVHAGIKDYLAFVVDPESWQENGGRYGGVYEIGGLMVVRQTPKNMDAVRAALRQLHEAFLRDDFSMIDRKAPTTQASPKN